MYLRGAHLDAEDIKIVKLLTNIYYNTFII